MIARKNLIARKSYTCCYRIHGKITFVIAGYFNGHNYKRSEKLGTLFNEKNMKQIDKIFKMLVEEVIRNQCLTLQRGQSKPI